MNLYDKIFADSKTIAVVGLSSNPSRPSYGVTRYMQSVGYRIIPINPNETEVLNEKSYARLEDVPVPVDIVDIFRRSEFVEPLVDSALKIGAKVIWMQEGVFHRQAAERARRAGLVVIMDRCILKEHMSWVYTHQHASPLQPTSEVF
ncbi:MAG: CoA-binding protein [Acidobacteriia bacterium]|nr:CoA-binding protein [Terriglobia bacterium]